MALREVSGQDLADALNGALPGTVQGFDEEVVWVQPSRVHAVAEYLRDDPSHDFQFLNSISAVDYVEYFDLVYHLTSLRQLSTAVFKVRVYGRDELNVPSVYRVWRGADFQEREIWDLMGIRFNGHPNMKRIMLWEGFEGHPLRKDFL
ncbi:MAG: NADH-quinone oxidoreductase subunit C [Chloroflexota bacterium]|nr:NADH-quinone oxidoreductase subunit C [Chloroflexota bacterium]